LSITLYPHQQEALDIVKNIQPGESSLIALPTATGKTIVFAALSSQVEGRVLIVVPSTELRIQAIDKLLLINPNLDIGSVQASLDEVNNKIVVSTRQSLTHIKSNRIERMLNNGDFEYVIFDECLVGDTLICMKDGSFNFIKDIKNNNKILGGKISNKFNRQSDIWRIEHSCGILEGSPTHPTFIVPYTKFKSCNNNFTIDDLIKVNLQDIKENDFIPVLKKIPHTTKTKWTPEQLSFVALIQADGHLDKKGYRTKVNITKDQDWYEDIFYSGLNSFNEKDICKKYDIRNNLLLYTKSRNIRNILENTFDIPKGKKSNNLIINKEIQHAPLDSIKAYIETLFSCEGDLCKVGKKSYRLSIGMCSKYFIQTLSLLLRKFGIISTYKEIKNKAHNHNIIYRLTIGSQELNKFYSKFKIISRKTAPIKNIGSEKLSGYDIGEYKLVKVKRSFLTNKNELVYDFTTTSHTFIANGILTHNCHQAANQLIKIIDKLNSNVKIIGFTATPYTKECIDIFGEPAYRRSIYEMIMDNYLCEPMAYQVSTKTNLNDVKVIAGEFNQRQLENTVNNIERNRIVVESYKKYSSNRKATLVFASGISHSNDLAKEFTDKGIYCRSIDSTLTDDERDNILEEFKFGKLPVLVNCMILTVGFDHPPIDCLILARPTKSRILYEQILGRGLRLFKDKENCLVIDVQDIIKNHDLMDISAVFDMNIKSGETIKQAEIRIQKEHEENEKLKQEEELRKIEQERKRQEELELIAKQIKLFNKDLALRFRESYYDWFKIDNFTYAVSQDSDNHFVIENDNNEFYVYKICTDKKLKYVECINTSISVLETINYVEQYCFRRLTSFVYRDAIWKREEATEKQKQYVKWAKTKWQVHCYFIGNSVKWQLKKYKLENAS